jgi:hypothetical protein
MSLLNVGGSAGHRVSETTLRDPAKTNSPSRSAHVPVGGPERVPSPVLPAPHVPGKSKALAKRILDERVAAGCPVGTRRADHFKVLSRESF